MTFELFRKIVDEAEGVRSRGQPHPPRRIPSPPGVLRDGSGYASDAGIVTKLHTNGSPARRGRKPDASSDPGFHQLTFSFDGYDKATYESIRVNGCFEKTIGNILGFHRVRKELGAKRPHTILELIDFPDIYRNVGRAEKKKLPQTNSRACLRTRSGSRTCTTGRAGSERDQRSKKYSPCTFLWASLIIFWDGAVLPCTQDFFGDLIARQRQGLDARRDLEQRTHDGTSQDCRRG